MHVSGCESIMGLVNKSPVGNRGEKKTTQTIELGQLLTLPCTYRITIVSVGKSTEEMESVQLLDKYVCIPCI